jgi:hypothetical protein
MATSVLQGADIRASNIIGSTVTATTLVAETLSVADISLNSVTVTDLSATTITASGTITGQKVVGAFGPTSGLTPLPVAPFWSGIGGSSINAYNVGNIVVSDIGGGVFAAFQCLVNQPIESAAPVAGANWQQLVAPFTGNLQVGRALFPGTEMVAETSYTTAIYVPGLPVNSPVFVSAEVRGTWQFFAAATQADVLDISVLLNGTPPANTYVNWFAPVVTA